MTLFTKKRAAILFFCFVMSMPLFGAKPHEENNWYKIGKVVGSRCRKKLRKERDGCCTGGCHKAGAYKPADLGACKEGCVFYKPPTKHPG